jgi:glycosyltransferase involved in cell wall biosynthesis
MLLSHGATGGRYSYDDVLAIVRAPHDLDKPDRAVDAAKFFDPEWTLRLARVLAFQQLRDTDLPDALALCEFLYQFHGGKQIKSRREELKPVLEKLHIELLFRLGNYDRARALLPDTDIADEHRLYLGTDLINPFVDAQGGDYCNWLELVNRTWTAAGLEPIELSGGGATPFDLIRCQPGSVITDGPLVSVIMTTYRPDGSLLTSIESIMAQSWQNLELILVDDGSPADYKAFIEQCLAMDNRIQLLMQPENGGTYLARNAGMHVARGEFVTFQDSDDWSHPRRLELQVERLLTNPNLMATRSIAVRVSESLILQRFGYGPIRPNASSLLFRRDPVINKIGYFDSVRMGADSEYHRRIETVFGKRGEDVVEDVPAPLAYIRMRDKSLSRNDFSAGWHHGSRYSYQTIYAHWHAEIAAGSADPHLPQMLRVRPFPAPARFAIDPADRFEPRQYDVVFLSEWRRYGGPQKSMIEEIRALKARGMRIGIAQMESFRFMTTKRDPLCFMIRELIIDGTVDHLLLDQLCEIRLLIIRYPPVLQFPPEVQVGLRAQQILIVANQSPAECDGSDRRYDVTECTKNARELFGVDPVWVPQSPTLREILKPLVRPDLLAGFDMPGIIDPDEWITPRKHFRGTHPIIGRHSRDDPMKWPADANTLARAYPAEFDVRIMGGHKSVQTLLESLVLPPNWTSYDQDTMSARAFLFQLDFFVYFHHPQLVEAFGRAILEAIASGCVVILPHHFIDTFGAGAVYCNPDQVKATVERYYDDHQLYQAQSDRAIRHVRETFGHESYADLVSHLLTHANQGHDWDIAEIRPGPGIIERPVMPPTRS